MNILSGISSSSSSSSAQPKQERLTKLTSKNVECHKQPLFVRPISNEEKIRAILNMQDPLVSTYQQQRSHKKMWKEMQQRKSQQEEGSPAEKDSKKKPMMEEPTGEGMMDPREMMTHHERYGKKEKLNCYWSELVKLQGLPVSSVRAYWAQQHRCIIMTAKSAQLERDWQSHPVSDDCHFYMENISPLTQEVRWNEEKNLHRIKRVIPVPNYVCAKDLECFVDTQRRIFIACARRNKISSHQVARTSSELKSKQNAVGSSSRWVDSDCLLPGSEQELHQRCQPTKALLKCLLPTSSWSSSSSSTPTTAVDDWQRLCKSIAEDSEWQGVSQMLREQLKEMKRSTFPGILQTPRFVKDEKSGQWSLRLQLRLRSAAFRPEDVRVRADEKRHTILVEALREVQDPLTRRVVQIRVELPLTAWVEVNKMKSNFSPQEGLLRLEIPLSREHLQEWQKQHPQQQQ